MLADIFFARISLSESGFSRFQDETGLGVLVFLVIGIVPHQCGIVPH